MVTAGPAVQCSSDHRKRRARTLTSVSSIDLTSFLNRLTRLHALSGDEKAAIGRLPFQGARIAAGGQIAREGHRTGHCTLIVEGYAYSYKLTGGGQRQIVGLFLAGELPDLPTLHLGASDAGIAALTDCRIATVAHEPLRRLCEAQPRLASALWRETLLQASIAREWMLNIGQRDALARAGHLFCEIVLRQREAGLSAGEGCDFPITQIALADALGLSSVHINRMVQELRNSGLIEWDGRRLTILDWRRLSTGADFDPAYLRLADAAAL